MSRKRRRSVDIFNLSFLDVVSCGFGAIILLLVIVKISEPHVIEQLAVDLTGLVQRLEAELHQLRGDTTVLNRELEDVQEQTSDTKLRLARLQGELNTVKGQYEASQEDSESTIDEGALLSLDDIGQITDPGYKNDALATERADRMVAV